MFSAESHELSHRTWHSRRPQPHARKCLKVSSSTPPLSRYIMSRPALHLAGAQQQDVVRLDAGLLESLGVRQLVATLVEGERVGIRQRAEGRERLVEQHLHRLL